MVGASSEVQAEQIEALLLARHPVTGARLGRSFGAKSARAFDAQDRVSAVKAGFTLRVYAHLFPSSEDRARHAADRSFGAAGVRRVTSPAYDEVQLGDLDEVPPLPTAGPRRS